MVESAGRKLESHFGLVVSILLYDAETWTVKALNVHRLVVFTTVVFIPSYKYPDSNSGMNGLLPSLV